MKTNNVNTEGKGMIPCLPQHPKIDAAAIAKLQCQIKVCHEPVTLHVHPARSYLHCGKGPVVDDNGEIVTLLDPDIDKKFVISERDINLYFAMNNEVMLNDENVFVEIVPFSMARYRI